MSTLPLKSLCCGAQPMYMTRALPGGSGIFLGYCALCHGHAIFVPEGTERLKPLRLPPLPPQEARERQLRSIERGALLWGLCSDAIAILTLIVLLVALAWLITTLLGGQSRKGALQGVSEKVGCCHGGSVAGAYGSASRRIHPLTYASR